MDDIITGVCLLTKHSVIYVSEDFLTPAIIITTSFPYMFTHHFSSNTQFFYLQICSYTFINNYNMCSIHKHISTFLYLKKCHTFFSNSSMWSQIHVIPCLFFSNTHLLIWFNGNVSKPLEVKIPCDNCVDEKSLRFF